MIVLYEVKNDVAIVTLNRPELSNALTVEMRELLGNYFEQAGRDSSVLLFVQAVMSKKWETSPPQVVKNC